MKKILYSQRLRLLWAAVCLTVGIGPILAVPAPKGKITVSGMVTDKNKQPLIGVTVIIKDTFSGTTTDNAGKYTQYVDWVFDGDDIIAVSRTAFPETRGLPARQHDANFLTFHRISNFRNAGFETEHIGYDQL